MKRLLTGAVMAVLVLTGCAGRSLAQSADKMTPKTYDKMIMEVPGTPDLRALTLQDLKNSEEKLTSLAEAIPADKYRWRPTEGVRSVSEVFMHVANANYFYPTFWGVQPPASIKEQDLEKSVTDKAKVVQTLKDSFAHLEKAVDGISDEQMAKSFDYFGRQMTTSALLFHVANHEHEHLGQLIAYARMNGVTPPWSKPSPGKEAPKE